MLPDLSQKDMCLEMQLQTPAKYISYFYFLPQFHNVEFD